MPQPTALTPDEKGTEKTDPATPAAPDAAPAAQPKTEPQTPATPATPNEPKTPAEPAQKTEATPSTAQEELQLKVPPEMAADETTLHEFKTLAKQMNLKSPDAQKLVDFSAKQQLRWKEQVESTWENQHKQWLEEAKADKEVGGDKYDANLQVARRAIAKFGTPELTNLLGEVGLGNHRELIRFCYRVGKALAEDSVAGTTGNPNGNQPQSEEAQYRVIFPTMFKER
jgi:hypothetical protein